MKEKKIVPALVEIPAGEFEMGDACDKTSIVHMVYVSDYSIESDPVTDLMWKEVLAWAESAGIRFTSGKAKDTNHPIQTVPWLDAVRWCNARSGMDGIDLCYDISEPTNVICNWDANGWRLPTEAEWEKAARGGLVGQRFPTGMTISQRQANYMGQSYYPYDKGPSGYNKTWATGKKPYTSPVGKFPSNGFGLYDMAGNVQQWCWDWYSQGYYKVAPVKDPKGAVTGTAHVIRGGSWNDYATVARVAWRGNSSSPLNSIGFRCVMGG